MNRLTVIKYFGIREKMVASLASMSKSYIDNLNKDNVTFDNFYRRLYVRTSMMASLNQETKKLLILRNFDYDFRYTTVPDILGGNRNVIASHALLIVINYYKNNN